MRPEVNICIMSFEYMFSNLSYTHIVEIIAVKMFVNVSVLEFPPCCVFHCTYFVLQCNGYSFYASIVFN